MPRKSKKRRQWSNAAIEYRRNMEAVAHAMGLQYDAETGHFLFPLDSYEWAMEALVKTGAVPSILRISSILERESWRAAEVLEEKAEQRRVYKRAQVEAIVDECERMGKQKWIATETTFGFRKRNLYAGTPFGVVQGDDRCWYIARVDGDEPQILSSPFVGPGGSAAARRSCELYLACGDLRDGETAWCDRDKANRLQSFRITPQALGIENMSKATIDRVVREASALRRKRRVSRHTRAPGSLDCDGKLAANRAAVM